MAVMATEQPQSMLADHKGAVLAAEAKMAIDEPFKQNVNGHATSDDAKAKSEEAPVVNGDTESPAPLEGTIKDAQNHEAFAANSNLQNQTGSPADLQQQSSPKDTTVSDADAATEQTHNAAAKHENAAPGTSAAAPTSDSPPEAKASISEKPTPEPAAADSMDLDVPTEHPDLSSSAEHPQSTQETSAISDSAPVASPQELSQSVDVSNLEIKSPRNDPKLAHSEASPLDRATSPMKISREREEDASEDFGPAAKRAKTEAQHEHAEDSIGVATGISPAAVDSAERLADDVPDDQVISQHQNKVIRQLLANIKKKKSGQNFRRPVQEMWPGLWDQYSQMIENPVDLSLFEHKLREETYTNYGQFKADVRLLHENAKKFNGETHVVTASAGEVRREIFEKLSDIAKQTEPVKAEKGKTQPTRHAEPRAAAQPRRQSHSHSHPPASSPKTRPDSTAPPATVSGATPTSATAPAFALPPNGIPQIRRDSTREDGDRPKRPIHPPKNRDLDYQAAKSSRKRKLDPEMKFFDEVLTEIMKPKYYSLNGWFLEPVNPITLNIPTYFNIIKKPIDLGTMTEKLADGQYRNGKDVEKDIRLMVSNSELFNGLDSEVTRAGKALENLFKEKSANKDEWIARHFPAAAPASPEASVHESEEESEQEVDEEEDESIRNLKTRVAEETEKLSAILNAKKPDLVMLEAQQSVLGILQRKLLEERTRFAESKRPQSKKKSNKHRPKQHGSSSAGGNSKKLSGGAAVSKKAQTFNKKAAPKKKLIGAMEKAVIAEGINELDGPTLNKAVEIIKKDTNQKEDDDGQLELDIEMLSQDALGKLLDLVTRVHPSLLTEISQRPEYRREAEARRSNPVPKPKKNKPMNKHEQEAKIEKLKELKAQFSRQGSGSQEPMPEDEENGPGESSEEEESDSEEE